MQLPKYFSHISRLFSSLAGYILITRGRYEVSVSFFDQRHCPRALLYDSPNLDYLLVCLRMQGARQAVDKLYGDGNGDASAPTDWEEAIAAVYEPSAPYTGPKPSQNYLLEWRRSGTCEPFHR